MKLSIIGLGTMGEYCLKELSHKVETVYIKSGKHPAKIEKICHGHDIRNYKIASGDCDAVKDSDFVLFCVPTYSIHEKMLQILPYCKKGAIISGQTSRKTPEAKAFDKYFNSNSSCGLEMVTIHTMCDPLKSDAHKEILGIIRHNSSDKAYERAREFYGSISEHIEEFDSVEEHDTMIANTQIDTSRTFLSIAGAFADVGCFPSLNKTYSSAFDKMKFSLAMRVASQPSHVYSGIQFGSEYGKKIVKHAIAVESSLYRMIVSNRKKEYRQRVLAAKEKLFGEKILEPILGDDVMKQFGNIAVDDPNSDFSIIQRAVTSAESGRDIFKDLKATTPMHTSLVCLIDRLFNTEDALERAISAPFNNPGLRSDDLDFHDQIQGWSGALLHDSIEAYNSRHKDMREKLDDKLLKEQVDKSKQVIKVCRESMKMVKESGRFD